MINQHYCLNFDESMVNGTSQMDVNASFLDEDFLVSRRMLTSIPLQEGATAQELTDTIVERLEQDGIDVKMMIQPATDGCHTMLGVVKGAVELLRKKVPTIQKWGGNYLTNLIKNFLKLSNNFRMSLPRWFKHTEVGNQGTQP